MLVALDTETELITATTQAPRLVCVAITDGRNSELLRFCDAKQRVAELLTKAAQNKLTIAGHNISYDMVVIARQWPDLLPLIFEAYDAFSIRDTMIRSIMLKIAKGRVYQAGNSLDAVAQSYGFEPLDKTGGARTSYGMVRDVPIEYWPEGHVKYAIADTETTRAVYIAQDQERVFNLGADEIFKNETMQNGVDFAFKLITAYGLEVDLEACAFRRKELEEESARYFQKMVDDGLVEGGKVKTATLRGVVAEACAELGRQPKYTATGAIATDFDFILELAHESMLNYSAYKSTEKLLSTYVGAIEKSPTLHAMFNILVASGRSSCRRPNLQNMPRRGAIRELFRPRKGRVYGMVDYSAAEIRSLAQVFKDFGIKSPLIKVASDPTKDLHAPLAAQLAKISVEEAERLIKAKDANLKNLRQFAKAANFGFPGGMGVARFIQSQVSTAETPEERLEKAATYTVPFSTKLRKDWFKLTNAKRYFDIINELTNKPYIKQLRTDRIRGDVGFCDGANTFFQGMTADGSKLAAYEAVKACMVKPHSPLFGSHVVNYVHDELIIESPEEGAHEAVMELQKIMVDSMSLLTPDIPPGVDGAIARRWYKGAEAVWENGRLVPWEPNAKDHS